MIERTYTRICMCCGERKEIPEDREYCEECSKPNTYLFDHNYKNKDERANSRHSKGLII